MPIVSCILEWCDLPRSNTSLCSGHYRRKLRGQDLSTPIQSRRRRVERGCRVAECGRLHYAKDLCVTHYKRWLAGAELAVPIRERVQFNADVECMIPSCDHPRRGRGLCYRHTYIRNGHDLSDQKIIELFSGDPRCRICGREEWASSKSHLSIDHDHGHHPESRKRSCDECVRGLLCHGCNVGLGNFLDDPKLLREAANYLESARQALHSGV